MANVVLPDSPSTRSGDVGAASRSRGWGAAQAALKESGAAAYTAAGG